ncbi:MAG: 3-deoxy-manno-octulosonate cytidylyltransferase [Elusimicrobiota bacterium]|nr:3-deoxy-manno-octulosonate cytidylyltransferase [Elusimicrobiota bacterium]
MQNIICIIPARYSSTRFLGKVIAMISGKPMIQHVWEKAKKSKFIDRTIIATDDKKVFDTATKFGAEVIMTSKNCRSGTDRVAEVVLTKKFNCTLVVNLQADEPTIYPETIDKAIKALIDDKVAVVSTPVFKVTKSDITAVANVVKVVFDKNFYALYFSRAYIPARGPVSNLSEPIQNEYFYKHIGLYVYRRKFLETFVNLPQSRLEKIECLEQLRILENGYKIKVVPVSHDTIPVDTPEDLKKVIRRLGN